MADQPITTTTTVDPPIEHVFTAWDDALGAKDLDAAMALYHPDATLESPLVAHLLGVEEGIVRGPDALRSFVEKVFEHQPPERRRFRTGFLPDGKHIPPGPPRDRLRPTADARTTRTPDCAMVAVHQTREEYAWPMACTASLK
ncbi:MAG: nuclear transport factor 2 family protein [Solirubrobacteraceae bacterium]